jgi:hypothetical protein
LSHWNNLINVPMESAGEIRQSSELPHSISQYSPALLPFSIHEKAA